MKNIIISFIVCINIYAYQLTNELNKIKNIKPKIVYSNIQIKKGWNSYISASLGVDIDNTFKDYQYLKVLVYDKKSNQWAINKKIKNFLRLKSIEPNVKFYIFSNQNLTLKIKDTKINKTCKIIQTIDTKSLLDSGIDNNIACNTNKSICIYSRYISNQRYNIYNDTRVKLFYKSKKILKSKVSHYAPAIPKIALKYNKAYEGEVFFVFDYNTKKCYKGVFPSTNIPPFSTLNIIQEN